MLDAIAATVLVLIALAHSLLGERAVIGPLLATSWELPTIPRGAAQRLIRFAWHLTSLAWIALAAVLVGASPALGFAATCLSAAVIMLVAVPGHLAWPLFLSAGIVALWDDGLVPAAVLWLSVALAALAAVVIAGFHVAWAAGSKAGVANVIPQREDAGTPTFRPGPVATVGVAAALLGFAAIVTGVAVGVGPEWLLWLAVAALVVLSARVVGDGRWVGVTKRVRATGFARADDRYWTPLAGLLALGAASSLALAG